MKSPGELAASIERSDLPAGPDERFTGYGIMAQPFRSGHVLALRRFAHTSVGPGYTSVWHCDPKGRWTMWSDAPALSACPRYFGPALAASEQRAIEVAWPNPWTVRVRIDGVLAWETTIAPSPATRLMTAMASLLPDALWRNAAVLTAMSRMARPTLRAGAIRLHGEVPTGQWFRVRIARVWTTTNVAATLHGQDLGLTGPAPTQRWLGGFALPNRGLFAVGQATFEKYAPARHRQALPAGQ